MNELTCPHCNDKVEILQINCGIFRHAIFKVPPHPNHDMPHASKEICEKAIAEDTVVGCAKPFEIICTNGVYSLIKCDYK